MSSSAAAAAARAHIVVVGNAKGGSGKSTTAMHVITRLLGQKKRVAALDLDCRQQTLSRYLENRRAFEAKHCAGLPMPSHAVVDEIPERSREQNFAALCHRIEAHLYDHDTVVIDCPGSDTYLTRVAHGFADTIVTPVNDSFIDLDLLARVDPDSYAVMQPSLYSEMVFAQRKRRMLQDGRRIDWVVVTNRAQSTVARNQKNVRKVLTALSGPLGFRHTPGLRERVIFRELFLRGLTLSDVRQYKTGIQLSMHHVAAHQEVRDLVRFLNL